MPPVDETGYSGACPSDLRLSKVISTEESVEEIPKSGKIGIKLEAQITRKNNQPLFLAISGFATCTHVRPQVV